MHPIDRLHEIRLEIRKLRREARQIRELLLSGDCSNRGERFTAVVTRHIELRPVEPTPFSMPSFSFAD